jgi:hypothetical protein
MQRNEQTLEEEEETMGKTRRSRAGVSRVQVGEDDAS